MKGNWSWPGEEECTHLAGSFLCIHLGSSRSASCSDQAFIRLPAAQTQLAQYGRENRFPSPADIFKKKLKALGYARRRTRKEMVLNTALSNTPLHRHRLPFHSQPWKGDLTPQHGDPNHQPKLPGRPLRARRQEHPAAVLHTSLTDQGPKHQPRVHQPQLCNMAGNDLKEETLFMVILLPQAEVA